VAIQVTFATLVEDRPDASWQAVFERLWPGYRAWFLRSGTVDRPGYLQCRRALREHMPELVPIWERLVELAGGGDVEARFLSMWCPPRYITGWRRFARKRATWPHDATVGCPPKSSACGANV